MFQADPHRGSAFFVVEYLPFVVEIRQFGKTRFARTRELFIFVGQ